VREVLSRLSQVFVVFAILAIALLGGALPLKVAQAANPPVFGTVEMSPSSSLRSDAVFSHTVAAGPYRLLVVAVMIRGDGEVSSITYAGESLTEGGCHRPLCLFGKSLRYRCGELHRRSPERSDRGNRRRQ